MGRRDAASRVFRSSLCIRCTADELLARTARTFDVNLCLSAQQFSKYAIFAHRLLALRVLRVGRSQMCAARHGRGTIRTGRPQCAGIVRSSNSASLLGPLMMYFGAFSSHHFHRPFQKFYSPYRPSRDRTLHPSPSYHSMSNPAGRVGLCAVAWAAVLAGLPGKTTGMSTRRPDGNGHHACASTDVSVF